MPRRTYYARDRMPCSIFSLLGQLRKFVRDSTVYGQAATRFQILIGCVEPTPRSRCYRGTSFSLVAILRAKQAVAGFVS